MLKLELCTWSLLTTLRDIHLHGVQTLPSDCPSSTPQPREGDPVRGRASQQQEHDQRDFAEQEIASGPATESSHLSPRGKRGEVELNLCPTNELHLLITGTWTLRREKDLLAKDR